MATDWEEKRLQILLEAGEEAVDRGRYVFTAITIVGILILSAQFNMYFPWVRHVLTRPEARLTTEQKKVITEIVYRDLHTVSAPVLGIRFSGFDLSVMGSSAMAVLAVWFFYSLRRENHVVTEIARAAGGENPLEPDTRTARAAYLYHGIAHHFVFTEVDEPTVSRPRLLPRGLVAFLFYMPVWVPFVVVLLDGITLAFPFKVGLPQDQPLWSVLSNPERIEAVVRCLFGLVVVAFCWFQCQDCHDFNEDTRRQLAVLRQLAEGKRP